MGMAVTTSCSLHCKGLKSFSQLSCALAGPLSVLHTQDSYVPSFANFTNANVMPRHREDNNMTLREASDCHLHLHLVVVLVGVLFFQGNTTVDYPKSKATFALLQLDCIAWR